MGSSKEIIRKQDYSNSRKGSGEKSQPLRHQNSFDIPQNTLRKAVGQTRMARVLQRRVGNGRVAQLLSHPPFSVKKTKPACLTSSNRG